MSAPRGRATRPRVRWFSPPRRRWPASPRWSRATGWRRPTSAAGGPTGCATRSRGCAGGRTGAASRRPCLRARNACVDERWWGDHPGGRNPAEGRTGRAKELRAARTEGADELEHGAQGVAQQQQRGGQPFGNQKPSQPPDDVKQEREAVDRPGQRQLGLRRPDREAQPCRPLGASAGGFRRVSEVVTSRSPFVSARILEILSDGNARRVLRSPCATLRCAAPRARRAAAASSPPNR